MCDYYDQGGAGAYALGRLTKMTDPSGSESYTYDTAGRITKVAKVVGSTTYTTTYTLNTAGQPISVQYPSSRLASQTYDLVGHLTGVASGSTNFVTIPSPPTGYDSSDNVLSYTLGNGIAATFTYSTNRRQLSTLNYAKSSQTLVGLGYYFQLDTTHCPGGTSANDGLIQCITDSVDSGRTTAYAYDALSRLTAAASNGSTGFPQWGLNWTYDRYGNRLSQAISLGCTAITCPTNSLTFSASAGALTNRPDGYSFDACGDVLNDGTNTLTYDGECRMTSSSGSLGSGTYAYDGNGMRIQKVSSGTTTVSIFAGSQLIAEYDNGAAVGSPSREYIYAHGQRVAEIVGSSTYYFQTDHLSVGMLTDTSGNVLGQRGHFPYGESWYETGTLTPWKFTTYFRDSESGNDYAVAREYLNRFGRFTTPDHANSPTSLNNPQSWNRYTYVHDDPLNLSDPLGLYPMPQQSGVNTRDCSVDNVPVSCSFAYGLASHGGIVGCPNNDCSLVLYATATGIILKNPLPYLQLNCVGDSLSSYGCAWAPYSTRFVVDGGDTVFYGDSRWMFALASAGHKASAGMRSAMVNMLAGPAISISADILGAAIVGEAGSAVGYNIIYGQNALQKDPYHSFNSLLDSIVIENGSTTFGTGTYIQYNLPGYLGDQFGTYQLGGYWLDDGNFYMVHHYFQEAKVP